MSFSKNIRHCRRCIALSRSFRSYQSDSTAEPPKMPSRVMTVAQWKLLVQLKDYIIKLSTDKSLHTILNKEFASFMQKVHPSVYGKQLVKELKTTPTVVDSSQNSVVSEESAYSLPAVLKKKVAVSNELEKKPSGKLKWKENTTSVSTLSIIARTNHIVDSILVAESDQSKIRRVEDLSVHLLQYPECRSQAVRSGAIRYLLRMRTKTKNPDLQSAIQEAFSVIGFFDPPKGRGIRILSIDGGGVRGIIVIEMLKKLEELSGMRVHEMFDYICGVSTGAIIACAVGGKLCELDDLRNHYKDMSVKIFTQNAFWGTSSLLLNHSFYDTAKWEEMLKDLYGDEVLIKTSRNLNCPKVAAVSAVVNRPRVSAYVFRNYSLPYRVYSQYMGGSEHGVWEAARASAAAPTYFEEFKLGNNLHQDGGILVNNPTSVAIHEARQLWPNSPIQCVVSCGTGRTNPSHVPENPEASSSSWKNKFLKILDSATDTEAVHSTLNDLLADDVYYRFNPYLTEMLNMCEIEPEKIAQLETDVHMYMRRNEDKFQHAAKVLAQKRTPLQKLVDSCHVRMQML